MSTEGTPTRNQDAQKCGYVGLIGRPNVGKSTLLNHILKQKISITSRKPQTTRQSTIGVDTQDEYQAIYVDTPGLHQGGGRALNRYMVNQATNSARDVDILVMVIDALAWQADDDRVLALFRDLKDQTVAIVAVLTKIDLLETKAQLLPLMQTLSEYEVFDEIVPVCALRDEGIEAVRQCVFSYLPPGDHYFAEDDITDQTERQMVEEIVREKLMRQLGDELPHSSAVSVIHFKAQDQLIEIHAEIFVERDSQKRMVIGRQGQRLKLIGTEARKDVERLLDSKVMLHLWVKVRKGWTNNAASMKKLGYE
ncbi:MAG: GTPase Era [Pseudomonadota bacterium]